MSNFKSSNAVILGLCLLGGLSVLGYLLADAAIAVKQFERSVTVKGLSEREFEADIVLWPIEFTEASNNLEQLYESIDNTTSRIRSFLEDRGIESAEISASMPMIVDKSAQQYGGQAPAEYRYVANQTVTVYSESVATVRAAMQSISKLGKSGIVFSSGGYQSQTEYLFTRLNEVKPEMIEEATRKAREVAEKFAQDSNSSLGKIRSARQGQFSISARDKNNPHIKKVRVVSTVVYYLSD